jgi:hypothetical protein
MISITYNCVMLRGGASCPLFVYYQLRRCGEFFFDGTAHALRRQRGSNPFGRATFQLSSPDTWVTDRT